MSVNGPGVEQDVIDRARAALLAQRHERLARVEESEGLEESRDETSELEENALRSRALAVASRLDVREQHEIDEIDRALAKIATGGYGRCERCSRAIGADRLAAIPAARYCLDCEEDVEREAALAGTPEAEPDSHDPPIPPDFVDLSKEEIEAIVREELRESDGTAGIVATWTGRRIVLTGEVPSEEIGEIARQIVADRLGFGCEDRTRAVEVLRDLPEGVARDDTIDTGGDPVDQTLGADRVIEDPTIADDAGEPLTPPDRPIPEPRKE